MIENAEAQPGITGATVADMFSPEEMKWLHAVDPDLADALENWKPAVPVDAFPSIEEPFLQPDYIAALVNSGKIALMRREGGAKS